MQSAKKHHKEQERIQALRSLNILDTATESDFDQITFLASQICGTPVALISLLDEDRQWFKSRLGLSATETPRDLAFCAHAILQDDIFEIRDSSKDPRFADNPLVVQAPHVQFYAGVPLLSPNGYPIGTVCVIDSKPRELSSDKKMAMKALSNQVTRLLELRMQIENLKKIEKDRRVLECRLAESAKLTALGEMSAGIAHEVNNPLAIIMGKTAILQRGLQKMIDGKDLDVHDAIKSLQLIEHTAERIAKIVRALKTYSRNAEQDQFEVASVDNIINDTLELCRERFLKSDIPIKISSQKNFQIRCKPTQISQVLMNLLGNAFDAIIGLSQRWVEIKVVDNVNLINIVVIDSGPGIPQTIAKKMLQPFFTTKDVGKGTGLGLSISMGIMEEHGGSLHYDPYTTTTSFVLSFPKMT